jgi:hypothetical protein
MIISKYPELQTEYLYLQLSAPLLDYDINRIIGDIETAAVDHSVKGRIVQALKEIR